MPAKLSNEFVSKFFLERNYLALEEYKNASIKMLTRCLTCGHEWKITYRDIYSGYGCPICGRKRANKNESLSYEHVKNYIYDNSGDILLDKEYVNSGTKINIKCSVCGKIYLMRFENFKYGNQRCPFCGRGERVIVRKKTIDEIRDFARNVGCDLLSDKYINSYTKMEFVCNCGKSFFMTWNDFFDGHRCMSCGKEKTSLSERTSIEKIDLLCDSFGLIRLDDYKNRRTPMRFKCIKCGSVRKVSFGSVLLTKGCPICSPSLGEQQIKIFLDERGLDYVAEMTFDDCRYKNPLPFDFCIFNKYNSFILIEFQGIQHYEPIDFSGRGNDLANKNFELQKIKDSIKANYCENNGIPLIEVPYWEIYHIEEILTRELEL